MSDFSRQDLYTGCQFKNCWSCECAEEHPCTSVRTTSHLPHWPMALVVYSFTENWLNDEAAWVVFNYKSRSKKKIPAVTLGERQQELELVACFTQRLSSHLCIFQCVRRFEPVHLTWFLWVTLTSEFSTSAFFGQGSFLQQLVGFLVP